MQMRQRDRLTGRVTGRLQPHHAGGWASVEVILTDWPSASTREMADGGAENILLILWKIRIGSLFRASKTGPLIQRLL